MKSFLKKIIASVFLFSVILSMPVFSETAEPYTDDEFPVVLKDIRRAEIITLGAMPFITISVSMGWSFGRVFAHDNQWDYFVNPFAKASSTDEISSYTMDEQKGIIITSLCICAGLGITDYVYHAIKRSQKTKKIVQQQGTVIINPVKDDPDASKIPVPSELPPQETQKEEQEQLLMEEE